MAFLEDLGRSNALGSVNHVFDKAIDIRKMEDQDADRTLGRAIDLEQLGIQKETAKREQTKFDWAEKEQKAKEAIDTMPVPITSLFGVGWEKDPAKKMQFDKMKEKGLVEEVIPGVIMTTKRNADALKVYGKEDLEWTKQVNEANMLKVNNQITQVGAAMAGDKDALKALGLKPEELEAKKKELETKLSGYVSAHKRVDFAHQNQVELEKEKQKALKNSKIAADPQSPTGSSYYNSNNEVVLRGAPKPASDVAEKRVAAYDRHNKAWEALKKAGGKSGASGSTALMKNTEYLVSLNWKREDAIKLLTASKPMAKDSFIGQTTLKIMNNEMILPEEKEENIKRAIEIYNDVIAKGGVGGPNSRVLDDATAASIFQEAGKDPKKARELAKKRGYKVQ